MAGRQRTGRSDPFYIRGLSSDDEERGGGESGSESSGSSAHSHGLTARPTVPRTLFSSTMSPMTSVPTPSSSRVEMSGEASANYGESLLDGVTTRPVHSSPLYNGAPSPTSPRYTPTNVSSAGGASTGPSVVDGFDQSASDDGSEQSRGDGRHDNIRPRSIRSLSHRTLRTAQRGCARLGALQVLATIVLLRRWTPPYR